MSAISACVSSRFTLPGLPITSDRGGTFMPSVSSVPAATIDLRADVRAVQQNRAHADQALILDRAPVDDRAVADRHVVADDRRVRLLHDVHDGAVLHVASAGRSGSGSRRRG